MTGLRRGIEVHHVGNHSSCEKRKLKLSRLFEEPFGLIVSQKRSRKRSTTRITFPISSLSKALSISLGNVGLK